MKWIRGRRRTGGRRHRGRGAGNDDFASAGALSGANGSTSDTTVDATDEPGEPGSGLGGVWYTWTATVSGAVQFDTCADADFDTVVDVFSGGPLLASLSLVASNDDALCGPKRSLAGFRAEAGTTYWVRVSGFNGSRGDFTLSWLDRPYDDFAAARALTGASGSIGDSTAGATDEPDEPASGPPRGLVLVGRPGRRRRDVRDLRRRRVRHRPRRLHRRVAHDADAGRRERRRLPGPPEPGHVLRGKRRSLLDPRRRVRRRLGRFHARLELRPRRHDAADATDVAGNAGSGSATFTVVVTPSTLSALTKQLVRLSDRQRALGPQAQLDPLVTSACRALESIGPQTTARQKALNVSAYTTALPRLVSLGWLTADQKTTLTTLASAV
jgi:hypothetical protein